MDERFIDMCGRLCHISLQVNPHLYAYMDIGEYIDQVLVLERAAFSETDVPGSQEYQELLDNIDRLRRHYAERPDDPFYEMHVYPRSPAGQYHLFGEDQERLIDEAYRLTEDDRRYEWDADTVREEKA